jgi:hypothetical protein
MQDHTPLRSGDVLPAAWVQARDEFEANAASRIATLEAQIVELQRLI